VAAIGIAVGLLAMVTLLPALLVTAGRWIFWPVRPQCGSAGWPGNQMVTPRRAGSPAACPARRDLVPLRGGPRPLLPGDGHAGPARKVSAVKAGTIDAGQQLPEMPIIRTVPLPDPGDLVGRLPGPAALAWIRRGEGLVGWGEAARVILPAGEDRFTAGEKWMRALFEGATIDDQVGLPGCGPVAFGSFTFDPTSDGSVLVVPQAVIGRRAGRAWLTTIGEAPPTLRAARPVTGPGEVRWHDGSLTAPQWERAVGAAVARIRSGSLRKVVLARDLHATTSAGIDERLLLSRLAARYPDCYTFACAGLVGSTPELLIRRQDREISSLVLAGTTPRSNDPEQDAALGSALLASAKETEEHGYVAAGVRDSLAPLCDRLEVAPRPSLLRLANVQHLATAVTGRLAPAQHPGAVQSVLALLSALHPTAAVCGTPVEAAMELIRELEGMDRGRYAGPVGWLDTRGNGEWGIALRCAELAGSRARLFAGCGIVAGSDPAAELAEAQTKFRPAQFALEG
jgi:menaquinone-specific isochorismate synthase